MTGTPFFFDNNVFDNDADLIAKEAEKAQELPEFTKTELENAKAQSFSEGKKSGIQENEASTSNAALKVLQKIENNMSVLFAAEDQRASRYEEEAVHLSFSIIEKLFPLYTKEFGGEKLRKAIKEALCDHNTPQTVKIILHENIIPSMEVFIKQLENDFNKHITISPSPSCEENECQILWPEGGIICNHDKIAKKTLTIMQEALAERGVSVHDKDVRDDDNDIPKSNETGEA